MAIPNSYRPDRKLQYSRSS